MDAKALRQRGGMAAALLALILLLSGCAEQGPYPNREIRLIVHAAPGGISDAVSRYVTRALQDTLGVPVVAENRTGAAGAVALSYVAQSAPDGYTLGYAPVDLAIVPHLGYSNVTPDQFDFLTLHTKAPAVLAVPREAQWNTLETFLQDARENPGTINMGTAGTGSIWHLASLDLARAADVDFSYVPFEGAGPAVTALLGGHIDAVVAGPAEVQSHVESGTLRVLGIMAEERSTLFPDVPTFVEQGYDLQVTAWGGFLAPDGLSDDVRRTLIDALGAIIQSDDFERFCRERGLEVDYRAGEDFRAFVDAEYESFGELVEEADMPGRASAQR